MSRLSHYSDEELLEFATNYADDNPGFKRHFIDSLQDSLYEYDELTLGQRQGLENIIIGFDII